jgi:hypothetical protein
VKKLLILPFVVAVAVGGAAFWMHRIQSAPPTPIELNPGLVVQGGQVRLSEDGFYPGEPVDITVVNGSGGNATVPVREAQASLQGSLDATSVILPDSLPSGSHEVNVVGTLSGRRNHVTVWVRAPAPWLTIGPGDLKPKAPISLIVGGFAAGEPVQITMKPDPKATTPTTSPPATPQTLGTLTTDRVGNSAFSTVKVPFKEAGDYQIIAQGSTSHLQLKKSVSLSPYSPTFDLSPWYGPPGLKIQLNARGYAPGESVGIYVGGSQAAVASVVADKYGNFWGAGNVIIPYNVLAGPLDIRAVGTESGATATRQFNVSRPKPWLELTTYYGAPSAPVEFSGGGWAAGEQIEFHLGSLKSPAVATGQADAYGWLHDAGPVYVPRDATDQVVFVAVGQQSHAIATATFKVVHPFGLYPAS